jgi:hypothetical protein
MKSDHLKDSGVYGRIILKWFFRNWNGCTDWIDVAENKERSGLF